MEREESIFRSVALKAAVEYWKGCTGNEHDVKISVLKTADRFLAWLKDEDAIEKKT